MKLILAIKYTPVSSYITNEGWESFKMWLILPCGKLGSIGTYAAPAFQVDRRVIMVLKKKYICFIMNNN